MALSADDVCARLGRWSVLAAAGLLGLAVWQTFDNGLHHPLALRWGQPRQGMVSWVSRTTGRHSREYAMVNYQYADGVAPTVSIPISFATYSRYRDQRNVPAALRVLPPLSDYPVLADDPGPGLGAWINGSIFWILLLMYAPAAWRQWRRDETV